MMAFKIFRPDEWAQMQRDGQTDGAPIDLIDGYVHLSTAEQLAGTLHKHFADDHDLHLLACELDRMKDDIRWETSRGGALFPHLYRPLRMSDISWTRLLTRGPNGHETGPLE
ncbi:DUF952 domain-containing protein [Paracoccus sp. 11-3]|uniref:DUF952 domain-containing protein n=1 Tax=Paracoccus amoyensis TaxID=2760093 RepID=A0A926J4X2_9RHOB|nr:DUF952 domain-containing protein [Paracoccus amoyensis]MBC9245572.1 DUF952 domain-containing protein [Paracoccus amoyensis]